MKAKVPARSQFLRLRLIIHGIVQGVGFRPFVYRLAVEMGLHGYVINTPQGVVVEAEGEREWIDSFITRLEKEKPSLAYIQGMEESYLDPLGYDRFEIRESNFVGKKGALVLPDIATCPDCLSEIFDRRSRRYLYPFTNCTNCGPRFSIIRALPYDRPNTTMATFEMCEECRAEYEDPTNRRFHAQPIACPKCGPHLELWDEKGSVITTHADALGEAVKAIRSGKIVALKGLGGFQLFVDATNDDAVKLLRKRKGREEKPFALMYDSLERLAAECEISEAERRLLLSPESPIVLMRSKSPSDPRLLSGAVAPGNPYLGAMLPYTPLHHILMHELGVPVVATSGNLSDEPICINEKEAVDRLKGVADLFLVHDRPIERQVDDSVVRLMMGRVQVVRRARGYAPFPVALNDETGSSWQESSSRRSLLAVGGHLKNTVAVKSDGNVFVSQHIGDLSTAEAYQTFGKVQDDLQKLFDVKPDKVVHDLHPDYLSTQFARKLSVPMEGVQHHLAHIASCMAENEIDQEVLGVSWDGTGYGEDGMIWGGEFLVTDGRAYRRAASFRPFRLPGSTASVKEPRRTAIGILYEVFGDDAFRMDDLPPLKSFDNHSLTLLNKMLKSGVNSPYTTSAGRMFDAVASITGLRQTVSFEGQGAMELEFALDQVSTGESYPFRVEERQANAFYDAERNIDWEPMIRALVADVRSGISSQEISGKFHNTLVNFILAIAESTSKQMVVVSGGCFQNRYLTEKTVRTLAKHQFSVYWHQRIPPNDGGISLGQIFVAAKRNSEL